MTVIYRTDGAWGFGKGSNLTAAEVDNNFYGHETRLQSLEGHSGEANRSIDFISVDASNNMFITYTDSTVDGPFKLPVAAWNDAGNWQPSTSYVGQRDVFNAFGSVYLTLIDHVSAATFDANATDGSGHSLYQLLIRIQAIPSANISGTTFSPGLANANSYMRFTEPTGCVITIPTSASVGVWQPYTEFHFRDVCDVHTSVGSLTIQGDTGVTINIPQGFSTMSAFFHSTIFMKLVGDDEWDIGGQLLALSSP